MLSFLEDKTYVRLVVASLIRKYHIKHYEGKALIEILGWKVDLGIQPRAERGAAAAHSRFRGLPQQCHLLRSVLVR